MCKTKTQGQTKLKSKYSGRKGKGSIHFTSADKIEDSSEDEYTFTVQNKWSDKKDVVVGGVKISMIVDSGASTNIVDQKMWEFLKENRVKCKSKKCQKQLFAYGATEPLKHWEASTQLSQSIINVHKLNLLLLRVKVNPYWAEILQWIYQS